MHILRDISTQPRFNQSPTKCMPSLQVGHLSLSVTHKPGEDGWESVKLLELCFRLHSIKSSSVRLDLYLYNVVICSHQTRHSGRQQSSLSSLFIITLDNVSVSSEVIQLLLLFLKAA